MNLKQVNIFHYLQAALINPPSRYYKCSKIQPAKEKGSLNIASGATLKKSCRKKQFIAADDLVSYAFLRV